MQDWHGIISSTTITVYQERVKNFKIRWTIDHLNAVAYIESNWLIPKNRNRVVAAWTNKHLHLRNTTTSRAKGIHGNIKADIKSKNINMLYTWDILDQVVERQFKAIKHEQKRQKIATQAHYRYKIFDFVRGYVSFAALNIVYDQMIMARNKKDLDSNHYTSMFTKYGVALQAPYKTQARN
jgi:hypothetical protein